MIFRQLFDPDTSTYTYLIASRGRAVLVDPVIESVDTYASLLADLGLRLDYTLETHVHADHVTAASTLRAQHGSRSVVHKNAGASCADIKVEQGDEIRVGDVVITVLETPGHTAADVSYLVGDRVLTGDALFIGGCGRTDFQEGNPERLYDSVHEKLFTLPPDTLVFPGHDYKGDTVSTIRQEMSKNPRLGGGKTREAFVEIMRGLNLPEPRQIKRAVPANQSCGSESTATQKELA